MTETREDPTGQALREPVDLVGAITRELAGTAGRVVVVGGDAAAARGLRAEGVEIVAVDDSAAPPNTTTPGNAAAANRAGGGGSTAVSALSAFRIVVRGLPRALPIRTGGAAAVVAAHRLHEADDVDAALAEFARVLAPGGKVVVAANALGDRRELRGLWATAARDCGVLDPPPLLEADSRFPLDHAQAWLSRHFTDVRVVPLRGTVALDADAVAALLRAQRPAAAGVTWDLLASVVESRVRDVAAAEGGFTLSTLTGLAVGIRGTGPDPGPPTAK
ncbi:class I SAM-dependent methyltransferase [Actinokineospora enzanensis]|uniref:class I SAM-dependent methyltransferase n=1 Tax=Actinokineospora enzanensis TaxID=155975 RepID=UPI0003756D7E|nr:class I SAM-dependent methyltransferase [Actinokineospora enzanensis]